MTVDVVFGEWLIFHGFSDEADATRFARWVKDEYGRECVIHLNAAEANRQALFPYELDPPVVLVSRDRQWTNEGTLSHAAAIFGARFAGT